MYRKSCCTTISVGVGGGSGGMDRMFKFLFDGQGTVRRAILYMDRSCSEVTEVQKNIGSHAK